MARREYKYLIDEALADRVRRRIEGACVPDEHAPGGSYLTDTLYLDTFGLDCYRATLGNEDVRWKARIRTYPDTPGAPVFLEIKNRVGDTITKSRARADGAAWRELLERGELDAIAPDQRAAAEAFLIRYHASRRGPLVPQALIRYRREPYASVVDDYARVTLDRELAAQPVSELSLAGDPAAWLPIDSPIAMRHGSARSFIVLELKFAAAPPRWMRALVETLELPRLSFSKYARAVDAILDRPGPRSALVG